jgi:hypothetical protein
MAGNKLRYFLDVVADSGLNITEGNGVCYHSDFSDLEVFQEIKLFLGDLCELVSDVVVGCCVLRLLISA